MRLLSSSARVVLPDNRTRNLSDGDFLIESKHKKIYTLKDVMLVVRYDSVGGPIISKTFIIKEGFEFDGASIPPALWDLIGEPDDPDFLVAALVHDYLYRRRWNRQLADKIFRHFLVQEGVNPLKAYLMWFAVRLGGFFIYAGDTNKFWEKVRNFI